MEDKGNLRRPILFKFGVVLAISFAGFLYSRFRLKNKRPPLPPPSYSSSGSYIQSPMLPQFLSVNCRVMYLVFIVLCEFETLTFGFK